MVAVGGSSTLTLSIYIYIYVSLFRHLTFVHQSCSPRYTPSSQRRLDEKMEPI